MAARTARAEPARVFIPALVVFGLDACSATTFTEITADHHGLETVAGLAIFMFSTLGLTFYSGLLERLVGAVERDLPAPPFLQVLREMPYVRLLAADGIILVLDGVASLALVIPGIIVTTLCALVGPVISTEGATLRDAFTRSARLVAPHFLLVLVMITFPLAVENEVVTAVALVVHHEQLGLVFLSHLALGLVFGLVEVSLAERLLHGAHGPGQPCDPDPSGPASDPGVTSDSTLRSAPAGGRDAIEAAGATGATEGGPNGRDDSRHRDAGPGALPPAG
jgi:hypothetical protein